MGSASDYTKARALNNLSSLRSTIEHNNAYFSRAETVSEEFRKQLDNNSAALQNAQRQAIQVQQGQTAEARGNRDLLNDLYGTQANGRSFNALGDLGLNFANPAQKEEETIAKSETLGQQNAWLSQNKLDSKAAEEVTRLQVGGKAQPAKPQSQSAGVELATPLARSVGNENAIAGNKFVPQTNPSNDSQAARYGRRLQDRNPISNDQSMVETGQGMMAGGGEGGMGMGGGQMGGPGGGMGGGGMGGQMPSNTFSSQSAASQANQSAFDSESSNPFSANVPRQPARDAFMSSLDVEIPVRGREFFFTTPRGEVELYAQGVPTKIYQRAYAIIAVLAIAAAAWLIYSLCIRLTQASVGTITISCLLLLFGLISLVLGFLPIYGALALLSAVVLILTKLEMLTPRS